MKINISKIVLIFMFLLLGATLITDVVVYLVSESLFDYIMACIGTFLVISISLSIYLLKQEFLNKE